MKVIVSHDIDHIAFSEHWLHDLFIPKWLIKNSLYAAAGLLSPTLAARRLAAVLYARINRTQEVIDLDRRSGIASTFFIGMASGLGMSYRASEAVSLVRLVVDHGFAVGVHGVAYADNAAIQVEHDRLKQILGNDTPFGIRNHYLRSQPQTQTLQAHAGYLFDSTVYGLKPPYLIDRMVEFPVCLMDSYILSDRRNDLYKAKSETLATLAQGDALGLPYFTIIFHDCYFSELFPEHREWYFWLIEHLQQNYEVSDFVSATREMRSSASLHA